MNTEIRATVLKIRYIETIAIEKVALLSLYGFNFLRDLKKINYPIEICVNQYL